ncbi:hypothetical protein BDV18DRAFT_137628, partial [Aspergillus unguis]
MNNHDNLMLSALSLGCLITVCFGRFGPFRKLTLQLECYVPQAPVISCDFLNRLLDILNL